MYLRKEVVCSRDTSHTRAWHAVGLALVGLALVGLALVGLAIVSLALVSLGKCGIE